MNEEHLGTWSEFAAQVSAHVKKFADGHLAMPSEKEFAHLVEATFFASLYEEEARRVDFGVAWQPDARECVAVVSIAAPVLVTPKNLAKLAPATWGEQTSIAVRQQKGELVAWALMERNAAAHEPLTIRSLGPGILRVDYQGIPRALYARGETLLLGVEKEVQAPSRWMTQTFQCFRDNADPIARIDLRAMVIGRIAQRALVHGHGGMILVMPADREFPVGVREHYPVADGADILVKRYQQVVAAAAAEERLHRVKNVRPRGWDGNVVVRDADQILFGEAIELVARLTAIDNALLIDTDLRIRGFGVQVIEGESPSTTFRHINPYSGEAHVDDLSTFKGTRHPAGVTYCMRQPDEAAAIIISQDGDLSLAVKDAEGQVQVIGSYERAFGWR
ncbi:MAG: hypothetical protein QM831_36895 [Kofleriaceae bacterium]